MRIHPGELRADFQQYYNLNLDGMGRDYTTFHAADLAAHLPKDARTSVAENPMNVWTPELRLLAIIEYRLHWWNWAHTEDGQNMTNYPKLLIPTEEEAARGDAVQMSVDEMMQFVDTLIAKEVDDG